VPGCRRSPPVRPQVEASFSRIEHWADSATGDARRQTVTPGNGTSPDSRSAASGIAGPRYLTRIYSWLLISAMTTATSHFHRI
jgi:Salmonella virulence plasmid 65kDa B protein